MFFNFRADRMRQLVHVFLEDHPGVWIGSMTRYHADHQFPVISPPQSMQNVLAECLSSHHRVSQCHIAGF